MKRLIITLLLLSAGAVVALPGAVGVVTERQHQEIARQVNAGGTQLTEEQYERGWFSSATRYRYRIEDERLHRFVATITGEPDGTAELLINSKIYHGPLPVIAGGAGRDLLAWTDMNSTLSILSPSGVLTEVPGELQSRIKPDGSSRFRYHSKAGSRSIREGLLLSWSNSDITIALGRNGDTLTVTGDIGLLKLVDESAAVRLGPTVVTANQKRSKNGVWTGDTALQIDHVSIPGFSGTDVTLETTVLASGRELTYSAKVKADDLQGEGFTGRELRIDFSGVRLDELAIGSFLRLLSQYPDPGQIPAAQRDALMSRVLATGPELTLHTLKIPMPDADIEGQGFVTVKPGTGITLSELSRGAQGDVTLLVPMTLVNRFRAQATQEMQTAIDMMMRLRILKSQGNRYKVEAAYANKLLTVNGFPMPIPNF